MVVVGVKLCLQLLLHCKEKAGGTSRVNLKVLHAKLIAPEVADVLLSSKATSTAELCEVIMRQRRLELEAERG